MYAFIYVLYVLRMVSSVKYFIRLLDECPISAKSAKVIFSKSVIQIVIQERMKYDLHPLFV